MVPITEVSISMEVSGILYISGRESNGNGNGDQEFFCLEPYNPSFSWPGFGFV